MITLNIKDTEGNKKGQLQIPQAVSEVKLWQYINLYTFIANEGTNISNEKLVPFYKFILAALEEFYNDESKELISFLTLGKIGDNQISDQSVNSLLGIYEHIALLITQYKPTQRIVQWNGYTWNEHIRDVILGRSIYSKLLTWQAIEAKEAERVYLSNKDNDPFGSYRYTKLIRTAAILSSKKGVHWPMDDQEVNIQLNERIRQLKEMPMDVALDIEAFFLATGKGYQVIQASSGSSRPRLSFLKQKLKGTPFKKQNKKTKKLSTGKVIGTS